MKIRHKLLADYQYTTPDKKIFLIKSGTVIEEYKYKLKGEIIPIDKDIVEANPELFDPIDWKAELLTFMRAEKMPQPAQLGKKLIPFFEEMIMSSIQQQTGSTDPNLLKEVERRELELNSFKRDLDRKESDLESRERRIKDREDEIQIRMSRVEKREDEYKLDLKKLEKKDDEIRAKNRALTEKELDLQEKYQELNERERNLDKNALMSAKEIDSKYAELQSKIDSDLAELSKREKELEANSKRVKELEEKLENNVNELVELSKNKIYSDLESELKYIENEIRGVDLLASRLIGLEASILVNHPVVAKIAEDLVNSVKSLRERVDNNLIN